MNDKFRRVILQDPVEWSNFIALLKGEKVTSYLEIGSKHGGSLWSVGQALPKGSKIVSVDLPHGDTSFKESQPHLEQCVKSLRKELGHDAHLYLGDSTDSEIIEKVRAHAPFDMIFIDANHTEPYVIKDWHNYSGMGRMIALHDIGWKIEDRSTKKMPIDVPKVWEGMIKPQHARYREIKLCASGRDNGIGIVWR